MHSFSSVTLRISSVVENASSQNISPSESIPARSLRVRCCSLHQSGSPPSQKPSGTKKANWIKLRRTMTVMRKMRRRRRTTTMAPRMMMMRMTTRMERVQMETAWRERDLRARGVSPQTLLELALPGEWWVQHRGLLSPNPSPRLRCRTNQSVGHLKFLVVAWESCCVSTKS